MNKMYCVINNKKVLGTAVAAALHVSSYSKLAYLGSTTYREYRYPNITQPVIEKERENIWINSDLLISENGDILQIYNGMIIPIQILQNTIMVLNDRPDRNEVDNYHLTRLVTLFNHVVNYRNNIVI